MNTFSKTIINSEGKILLYSVEDFYNNIVIGDDCFICGAKKGTKTFNNEHVLPDWLLTKYNLHSQTITFSNSAKFNYGKYTIPCCKDCNTDLGNKIEVPVSNLLKLSYNEICKAVKENEDNINLLFKWLMLIFFKTHLKDTNFYWERDRRKGTDKISDFYDWKELHHIHCMIRSHFTNAILDKKTLGSIFIVPAIQHSSIAPFDFIDNTRGQTILIRMDEFCLICVLNDSCGVSSKFQEDIKKIKGAMTPFQLRELFTHFVYINMYLKDRPKYYSNFRVNGEYHIGVEVPKLVALVEEKDRDISQSELLYYYCKDMIGQIENRESILQEIKEGNRRYLLDEKGEFIDFSNEFK